MSNKRVLVLSDWYLPGYRAGGPIRSVSQLVAMLQSDLQFSILTSDRDLQQETPYPNIDVDVWIEKEQSRVCYLSPGLMDSTLKSTIQSKAFDSVYLNSFFSLQFTIKPLWWLMRSRQLNKVILAPRGMLGEGALRIKPIKKHLFISLMKALGIHRKIRFHSTDVSETNSIRRALGSNTQIVEIPNVPIRVSDEHSIRKSDPKKFVFASRISPKKNLMHLLRLWSSQISEGAHLDIFGQADDDAYEKQIEQAAKSLKQVFFRGAQPHQELMEELSASHFFVLPTLNENFGHSIIEALAMGCPVIISDQTPWNDIESLGAGFVIPLNDEEKWKNCLRICVSMDENSFNQMSSAAKDYVRNKFNIAEIRTKYMNLFCETT